MRIAFLNTDYPTFLRSLYRHERFLALASYERQMAVRNASLFGTADFMSTHFREFGHEAIDIHANNRPLQEAWMAENASGSLLKRAEALALALPDIATAIFVPLRMSDPRVYEVLESQIRIFAPDVLYNHDPVGIPAERLRALAANHCAIVAQIASPIGVDTDMRSYDLVISSLPNFVERFHQRGIKAAYLPLAFERLVWKSFDSCERDIPLSFVGSVTLAHRERASFLEALAGETDISVWGDGLNTLPLESAVRKRFRGSAWGRTMFGLLARSQITLNKHIDISESYANNMRLFEATGMGACLITDWKENLGELFHPGKEVVAYRSTAECIDLIGYYKTHPEERRRIARAGQERCFTEHTYERRMAQLCQILKAHFG